MQVTFVKQEVGNALLLPSKHKQMLRTNEHYGPRVTITLTVYPAASISVWRVNLIKVQGSWWKDFQTERQRGRTDRRSHSLFQIVPITSILHTTYCLIKIYLHIL